MKNREKSAFPLSEVHEHSGCLTVIDSGLTKREYFAIKAMQGFLSNDKYAVPLSGNNIFPVPEYVSKLSVEMADALLKQLEP